ncbi:MAG: GHKL domain-containing protein, partial [Clostridiaceae bacterium]|nr:GHKL domain-containing protein [Clostridiaceae bacterium]
LQIHIDKEYRQEDIKNIKHKNYEIEITTINNVKKRLLYNSSKIYNIDGELIGLIIVASDITELKQQQEKMMQQEKLALLGQMGAGIVHETRNYLTTIKGSCQLIDTLTEEDKIKKYTKKMNKGIDEVNRILGEFLSLSKPRETELEEVSMYDIVYSIKSLIITSSLIRGINIDFKLSKEERYLLCDEAQVKQVVLNICKNAVEAMAEVKNAELKIEAGYNEKVNEMFIKITDNGYGMSKETLEKIGTPFYTTKSNGTGLGLNFCYKVIKEHGGRIEVKSELEKGTKFTVVLPCIEDDEECDKVI